jgi:hypothetical protein
MPLLFQRKLLGFRLGWVSGPPALVSKVSLYIAAISVGAASISQVRGDLSEVLLKQSTAGAACQWVRGQQCSSSSCLLCMQALPLLFNIA